MSTDNQNTTYDNTKEKEVQYYAALVNAFLNTRSELDKQLLTLSSLALGVLIAFMDKITDRLGFGMWAFACLSFLLSVMMVLLVISRNALLIEQIVNNEPEGKTNGTLLITDIVARVFFILGIISTVVFAIYSFDFAILCSVC